MANVGLPPALAKALMLAIAWADHDLHPEEEITIKEVISLLPSLSAKEWALIELYFVAPIGEEERGELLQQLVGYIRSEADKRLALEAIDAMINADGLVQATEEAVAQQIRAALKSIDVTPLGVMGRRLSSIVRSVPRRERALELWRTNPVLYVLRTRTDTVGVEGQTVEIAALAVAIMAQVARVASATADQERPVIAYALITDWQMPQAIAERMAEEAISLSRRTIDYHRISRELVPRTTEGQRVALLDALFAIANAAGQVSPSEIDEIRIIAERLQLTRQQFIAAKLKIPAAQRGGL
jgi:uncharacterized tellurite resistance protein B-like protein